MRLLKESIPGSRLEVLGYPGTSELAVTAGLADATWDFEHRSMAMLFAPGATIEPVLVERLKSYSLVVSYLFDPDGFFQGNMERIGVKTLIECPHQVVNGAGPAPAQLARPLERLAMFLEDTAPHILDRTESPPLRSLILHPGSGSLSKNWAVSNWRAVIRRINQVHPDLHWIVVTGEAEAERGQTEEILADWPVGSVTHWEGLRLTELAARFAGEQAVFLGHDSGISHLAAACGLPCFLLFGPTDPSVWAPTNPGVEVFQAEAGGLAELAVEPVWQRLRSWLEPYCKTA